MNIDMFWIWLVIITSTLIFQNHFTEKVTTWDVVYTYTDDSTDFLTYGQMSLTSHGSSLPWRAARRYIKNDVEKKEHGDVVVTILAVHKEIDKRVFNPFWKHIDWYEK